MDKKPMNHRPSYFEKAVNMGIEEDIAYAIKEYVDSNDNPTYRGCYEFIQKKFDKVFYLPVEKVYYGNHAKIIKSNPLWANAYASSHSLLLAKSEMLIASILDDKNERTKDRLRAAEIVIKRDKDIKQLERDSANISIDNIIFGYKGDKLDDC